VHHHQGSTGRGHNWGQCWPKKLNEHSMGKHLAPRIR
jgi:hypothetical protein